MDISDLRRDYATSALDLKYLAPDPHDQFAFWFDQACKAGLAEPNAMVLSTVDENNRPHSRMVLLKQYDQRGYVFFTNLKSAKAEQITANPFVALLFPWLELERQVTILGIAEKLTTVEVLRYFVTRPIGSRLSAWASPQSQVVASRSFLEAKIDEMKLKFAGIDIPAPSFWGGYRVKPEAFEFWQGRPNRLHDRFRYLSTKEGRWQIDRLAP